MGGTLACGPIQAHVSQRDTAGFRPVQPGSMRSATVLAMLSPAGTHQGHFSRDLIGICFGLLRAGKFDKRCCVGSSQLPSFLPSFCFSFFPFFFFSNKRSRLCLCPRLGELLLAISMRRPASQGMAQGGVYASTRLLVDEPLRGALSAAWTCKSHVN